MEANKTFNAPEVKLHFLDYWRIIRIRKTVIFAVFLLVTATTTLVTFMMPEKFSSMVRIRVEKDALDVGGIGERNSGTPGFDPFWVQDQFETIQSRVVLHTVISNLNLTKKWAPKFKEPELPLDLTFGAHFLVRFRFEITVCRTTRDRKSTRLNSSHTVISYTIF